MAAKTKMVKPGPPVGQPKFATRKLVLKNVSRAWQSTSEIAEKCDINLGNALYHLQLLAEDGAVLTRTNPDRLNQTQWKKR